MGIVEQTLKQLRENLEKFQAHRAQRISEGASEREIKKLDKRIAQYQQQIERLEKEARHKP